MEKTEKKRYNFPLIASTFLIIVAVVNIISTIYPPLPDRFRILREIIPLSFVLNAQTATVLFGFILFILASGIRDRRKRPLEITIIFLLLAGIVHILKGLDIEEAVLNVTLASVLFLHRKDFTIESPKASLPSVLRHILGIILLFYGYIILGFFILQRGIQPHPTLLHSLDEPYRLLFTTPYYHYLRRQGRWFEESIIVLGFFGIIAGIVELIRPFISPTETTNEEQDDIRNILKMHGRDTLSYFSLQEDRLAFFNEKKTAYISYVIWRNVAISGGDPVGNREESLSLIREYLLYLKAHNIEPCFLGISGNFLSYFQKEDFICIKIGEEAIIHPQTFDVSKLSKKTRRAVRFVEGQGVTVFVQKRRDLLENQIRQMRGIAKEWLSEKGGKEYGFSMTLKRFPTSRDEDCEFVIAQKGERILGYLILVPVYQANGYSLDSMKRRRDSTNGLMEFIIVKAVEYYREKGSDIFSLNFAAFADSKEEIRQKLIKQIQVAVFKSLSSIFPLQSLYNFNNKFLPEWQSRYVTFQDRRNLPLITLAILQCERQIETPFKKVTKLLRRK